MTTTVVYLSINGIEQNLEVDLDYACFADVAEAFGFRTLRRIGTKCILSPRLKLKTVLPHENEAYCRFALLGDVQEAGTLAGVEVKLDELTALVRELPGKLALASSSDGRLSQQWNRPRTTNGGYQKEPTEEDLEAFLLGDRSLPNNQLGLVSNNGSRADLVNSPNRSSIQGGEFNATLHDAQKLIDQLSNAADKQEAAEAVSASKHAPYEEGKWRIGVS